MHVAMIDPTVWHQGRLLKLARIGYFPLTLPRLAALVPPEHRVTVLHEKCEEVDAEAINCDVAMFTTMGSNIVRAEELSAVFRRRGIPTVIGGYWASSFLDRCRENFDAVVLGDGEGLMPRLLDDVRQQRLQKVYENLAPSLADLPLPRYDLVPSRMIGDIIPVEASRGCPNACGFCAVSSVYGSVHRKRPVDHVVREIEAATRAWGRSLIYFTDPNFAADARFAKEILHRLVGRGVRWLASVDVRAVADREFLQLARASGCFCLQVGLETVSPASLGEVNKEFTARVDFSKLLAGARAEGIPIVALLMFGFDNDTAATFRRTLAFLEREKVPMAVTHIMAPIPGTPVYERLGREGRLLSTPLRDADGLHLFHQPLRMSADEFMREYWRFNERAASLRSLARRFLHRDVWRNPIAYLIMLATNLFLVRKVIQRRLPMGMYE